MSVLFELISGDPDPLAVWKADFINFVFIFLAPAATPKQPGVFSTSTPVVSSSSADSPSHSPSRPRQDDCMRPVRRLPVSDLPCLESKEREGGRAGVSVEGNRCQSAVMLRAGWKVKKMSRNSGDTEQFPDTTSDAGSCLDISRTSASLRGECPTRLWRSKVLYYAKYTVHRQSASKQDKKNKVAPSFASLSLYTFLEIVC